MSRRRQFPDGSDEIDEEKSYEYSMPLFTPVVPPKITSISHEALVKWRKQRREYEAKMRARCRSSGEDCATVTQTVKESFDVELFDVFCSLRLRKEVEAVTERILIAEIEALISRVKNDDLPDIKELFKNELRMDLREGDVDARVLKFFQRFNEVVMENGLEEIFQGAEGEKEKCKRVISCLAPPVLKADIKSAVRWTHKDAAKNFTELYTLVYEKAVEHERHFQQNKRLKMETKSRGQEKPASVPSKKAEKKAFKDKSSVSNKQNSQPQKADKKADKNGAMSTSTSTNAREPPSPCPKCQEMHWLSDCPKATEAEKVALRQKLRDAKTARKAQTKRLVTLMPTTSRTVTINGVLELPCCPDSGSDFTVMSRSHWNQLAAVDSTASAELLGTPVRSLTFGAQPVVAYEKAMLHVRIHTAAGPVELTEPVSCLIVETDDEEFIIGNDMLGLLGIDVDRQLEQLAARHDDDTSGDPFELEADEPPSSSTHTASDEEVRAAVETLIGKALDHGFPEDKVDQLRVIVHMYDVWRLELRDDPPARVPPLVVRLKEGAEPSKCKPRRYPPHIRKFLRDFNDELVRLGLVYENPTSRWASPILPVKKSSEFMDLRQTTDYRAVNAKTEVMAAVMPILTLVMEHVRGANHFGLFDFLKGFWQLPLADLCQEWMSYMTDEKIFTPRRVPQGCSDAAIHFQKTMEQCFAVLLYKHLLIWIDDLLLYADDIDIYLAKLAELFSLLNDFGLKLSVKKLSLYQKEVKWCGKVIDSRGVRHDPARIDALQAIPYPTNAGELQQFLCAVNWMRESLVDYARQVAPLQRRLDAALSKTRRTKQAAAGITIELNSVEKNTFDKIKGMLASAATLDFPDDSATTCLFTDASDVGWALIVTQVKDFDIKTPIQDQQHRLIECLSGTFTGSQLNWTVIEKEAFPITMACDRLDYLLQRPQGFRMFCDHRNLIHVFAPDEHVKKHVKGKLLRWSLKLMNFRYIIEHIAGLQNVWADMISRWAGNRAPTTTSTKRIRAAAPAASQHDDVSVEVATEAMEPIISTLRPLDGDNFVWPALVDITAAQSSRAPPPGSDQDVDGLVTLDNRIWIPPDADLLLQRLFVIAHCGAQGHRGIAAMVEHLRRIFAIDNLHSLVSTFAKQCRLCLNSKGGRIILRPWGETIECSERNGVLHFDFLFMGKEFGDAKYLLVIKDHATHYCELTVADTADSAVTVEALLAWHARFGLPPIWVSDNGSHFKNEVVSELSRRLCVQHQFTPAYCPWINGSVERVNRDILRVMRTMILEYKLSHHDWIYLVPMVQSSLNHTAVPSLGNRAPVELFTGLQCPTPLREFYLPTSSDLQEVPASDKIDTFLSDLRDSIRGMHKVVEDQRTKQRMLNKKRERGENVVNFTEGDFVLRSRVDEKDNNKLLVTWVGPYRILRADAHSFLIQHLITGAKLDVYASRLKFYADASLHVTEELLEHIAAQGIVLAVDKLKGHRWNDNIKDYEVLVQWKGLEEIENSYEPLTDLARDVPILVEQYVNSAGQDLKDHWQQMTTYRGRQPQQQIVAPAALKGPTRRKSRRRPNQQQPKRSTMNRAVLEDSSNEIQASNRGDCSGAAQLASTDLPGPESATTDSSVTEADPHTVRERQSYVPWKHRAPESAAEEDSVSRRTRSRIAGARTAAARPQQEVNTPHERRGEEVLTEVAVARH